jgi:protein arginine N-methyltransferase 7
MLQDKIKLVRKRSTELRVGPGQDMERRANLLVTEVIQPIIVVQIVPNK